MELKKEVFEIQKNIEKVKQENEKINSVYKEIIKDFKQKNKINIKLIKILLCIIILNNLVWIIATRMNK